MSKCDYARLRDRALLQISGNDAEKLLQGIVTCDVEELKTGTANFGALLTPQGKVLFDFFLIRTTNGFLIDIDASLAEDFVKRLNFYKLRADVTIENAADELEVYAIWNGEPDDIDGIEAIDPRLSAMGSRLYGQHAPEGNESDYNAHRIELGIPEGGKDYEYGKVFPHEVLMDQFGGIDFAKGCYVGQEVVSRMQHRGKIRTRMLGVRSDENLPAFGTEIRAAGKPAGNMGSSSGQAGLALLRMDRVHSAMDKDETIVAGDHALTVKIPEFVNFGWPQD
ncbi:MAG: folate-binding protein YgfZ [Pseudomonadota bacterium]